MKVGECSYQEGEIKLTLADRAVYMFVYSTFCSLKVYKDEISLTIPRIAAHCGISESAVKKSIKVWKKLRVFDIYVTYNPETFYDPMNFRHVVDIFNSEKHRVLNSDGKVVTSGYRKTKGEKKVYTYGRRTEQEWSMYRKNCIEARYRGRYLTKEEKKDAFTRPLFENTEVFFEWEKG